MSEKIFFYKKGKKVTIRHSRSRSPTVDHDHANGEIFSAPKSNDCNNIKLFLKYVVTDVEELNYIKNDICFLINDIFDNRIFKGIADKPFTDVKIPLEAGVIFYIWVFFPFDYNMKDYKTPVDIRKNIFAFDLIYIRQDLNIKNLKFIKDILKKQIDIQVYTRKLGERVEFPYKVVVEN